MNEILDDDREEVLNKFQLDKLVLWHSLITAVLILIIYHLKDFILINIFQWENVDAPIIDLMTVALFFLISYLSTKRLFQRDATKNDISLVISGGATIFNGIFLFGLIQNILIQKNWEIDFINLIISSTILSIIGLLGAFFSIRWIRNKGLLYPIILILLYIFVLIQYLQYTD